MVDFAKQKSGAASEAARYPVNPQFREDYGKKDNGAKPTETSVPQRKMVERESPEMVEFKAYGDYIEGRMLSALKVEITDKQTRRKKAVMEYTFVGDNGKAKKCLGSYDLDTKLRITDIGCWCMVIYVTDKEVPAGKMRVFKVEVEEKPKFADGQEITDEDIPF